MKTIFEFEFKLCRNSPLPFYYKAYFAIRKIPYDVIQNRKSKLFKVFEHFKFI